MGPPFTGLGKGDVRIAVGLVVILAGSSAIVAPLLLHVLLAMISGNQPLKIDAAMTQLIPLGIGLIVRHRRAKLAESVSQPSKLISTILNVGMFSLIIVVQFHLLESFNATRFAGMLSLVISTPVIGWRPGQQPAYCEGILNRRAQRRRQSGDRNGQFPGNARGDCRGRP
jgi:bile acid:Na+ symporter, BASS family